MKMKMKMRIKIKIKLKIMTKDLRSQSKAQTIFKTSLIYFLK